MQRIFAVLYFVADLMCRAVDVLFCTTVVLTEQAKGFWCHCKERFQWKQ